MSGWREWWEALDKLDEAHLAELEVTVKELAELGRQSGRRVRYAGYYDNGIWVAFIDEHAPGGGQRVSAKGGPRLVEAVRDAVQGRP